MRKHTIVLVFAFVQASTTHAANLALPYRSIEAAADFAPIVDPYYNPAPFPGSMDATGIDRYQDSSARAYVNYSATNSDSESSFNLDVDLEGAYETAGYPPNARVFVTLNITLYEPMAYSISGILNCATDVPGVEFHMYWTLFDGEGGSYYYWKDKRASDSAVIEADNVRDPSDFLPSDSTGILPPANYSFLFVATFNAKNAIGSTVHATGLTNLTLTRLVPEPSTLALLVENSRLSLDLAVHRLLI